MNPILLVAAAMFAILAIALRLGQRRAEARRSALGIYLTEQGYPESRVEWGSSTYGWPGYRIVFPTAKSREAFRGSPDHQALLHEIGLLHQDRAGFDPELACELDHVSEDPRSDGLGDGPRNH